MKIYDNDTKPNDILIDVYSQESQSFSDIKISNIKIQEIIQGKLPQTLKKLMIKREWIGRSYNYNLDNLPSLLEKLQIVNIDILMNNLPTGLKVLEILGSYEKSLDSLPDSLQLLKLACNYRLGLDNLPTGLEKLFILNPYPLPLKNLPIGLKTLIFVDKVNYQVSLPKNIKYVEFDESNNGLRRRFLKLYPKVIYNDKNCIDSSEGYNCDEIFHQEQNDDETGSELGSESDSENNYYEEY